MATQTIEVWGHWGAPNPSKICMILEELGVAYKQHYVEFADVKQPSYLELNPNGRLPTIKDPNTDVVLWESGAIILYLIEHYDKEHRISYGDFAQKQLTTQWLMFQVSGQAPYFGQATWFARFHPEKIQSAIDRYVNEIERVCGVLDKAVSRTGWLIGDKCTFADISFVSWTDIGIGLLKQLGRLDRIEKFSAFQKWHKALGSREGVAKITDRVVAERAAHNLP